MITVHDIATKVISESESSIWFAIKALVHNESDDTEVYVELQGIDSDGFEIDDITLTGTIPIGASKVLTNKTYVEKELFGQIVVWQEK